MVEPEIQEPLTQDEETVLLILAQGEYLAPIGRWEAPLKSLTLRGFARFDDREQRYAGTDAGRALADRKDTAFVKGWIEDSNAAVARKHGVENLRQQNSPWEDIYQAKDEIGPNGEIVTRIEPITMCGLTVRQVIYLIHYYEKNTGRRASEISTGD